MLTILAGFGSGFYVAYLLFRAEGYCCDSSYYNCGGCTDWAMVGGIGFPIGIGIAIVAWFFAAFCAEIISRYHQVKTEEQEIVAMKMMPSVSGSFCLGYGSVGTNPVYFYYIKDSKKQFRLQYVPAMESRINEEDNPKPHISTWKYKWRSDTLSSLLHWVVFPVSESKTYVFTIPKGSIAPVFQPL